jgi:hypothetical protein
MVQAMFGKVKSSKFRLPNVSIVWTSSLIKGHKDADRSLPKPERFPG